MREELRKLGRVAKITRIGYVIVEVEGDPRRLRLGSRVSRRDWSEVGRLVDIIGPVDAPYAVVKPAEGEAVEAGEELFVVERRRGRGRGRGRGRRGGTRLRRKTG